MKATIAALVVVGASWSASASDLTCTIKHGVYKFPVEAELTDALARWPELGSRTFAVTRGSGQITAKGFISNEGEEVRILRNIEVSASGANLEPPSLSNLYEVMSVTKNSSVKLLSIDVLDGQFYFKYYFSMMGLLLTGSCIGT